MKGVKGFQKGVVTNPGGRPPKEREAAYLLIMKEIVTAENWRNLCVDAYLGARGIKVKYTNGKPDGYEDDPQATPGSKLANKRFFADYLIGKPIERMIVAEDTNGELMDLFNDMYVSIAKEKDDKLDDIVEQAKTFIEKEEKKKRRKHGQRPGHAIARGDSETSAPDSDAGNNGEARDTVTQA